LSSYFNDFLEKQKLVKEPVLLYEPIEYALCSGGKRIRPVLLLLAYQLYDDAIENALFPALGVEVFHNYTLLHDDIMDKSALRRGNPTVHAKWNDNIAILSGDAMSIMSSQFVLKTPINHQDLIESFNKAAIEVCEGQQYDMDFEQIKSISIEDYIKMISLKTGALLAVSLKMGAIIANAPVLDRNLLYDFGMKMGIAFQLQDDWLDCFGDQKKFGKIIGRDILNEKKTFLLIKAYELASEEQKQVLDHAFGNSELLDEDKISFVLDCYEQLGVQKVVFEEINNYLNMAAKSLKQVSASDEKKSELFLFLEYLRNRSA
jgi:geranylgeranyl diphosphate synthase type II